MVLSLSVACQRPQSSATEQLDKESSGTHITQQLTDQVELGRIEGHLRFLADDLLEGRLPGSRGYDLAALYVESHFRALGLKPAGLNGTFRQAVQLVEASTDATQNSFIIENTKGQERELISGKDFFMMSNIKSAYEDLQLPVVFIGHGIHAPEIGYDDFAGVDIQGKVVALFRGFPATIPDSVAQNYAGKKWDNIIDKGAVGMIYLNTYDEEHEMWKMFNDMAEGKEPMANWGWINQEGKTSSYFMPDLKIWAELTQSAAGHLFTDAPLSFDEAFASVNGGTPHSFEFPVKVTMQLRTRLHQFSSDNIVAVLSGSDPVLKDEYLIYVAHLDHTGIGAPIEGDSIYNGAQDNASGTAILLEVARTFSQMPEPPKRSILFIGVTAEEAGLFGSEYFITYPTVPQEKIIAAISLDMPLFLHQLKDIVAYGAEFSSLAEPVNEAARQLDLAVSPDPNPEEEFFKRSDQYSFAMKGIPALLIGSGEMTGDPAINGRAIDSTWMKTIYHTPLDNPDQAFDWSAAVKLTQFSYLLGYYIANDPKRPAWNPGSEYDKKLSMK